MAQEDENEEKRHEPTGGGTHLWGSVSEKHVAWRHVKAGKIPRASNRIARNESKK